MKMNCRMPLIPTVVVKHALREKLPSPEYKKRGPKPPLLVCFINQRIHLPSKHRSVKQETLF